MKKVIGVMIFMTVCIVFFGGFFSVLIGSVAGNGVYQSYLYPIYAGIILLSGVVVLCTCVILEKLDEVRDEFKTYIDKNNINL